MKKEITVVILAAFCLTLALLTVIPIGGQSELEYDPWADTNDDGKIDMKDIGYIARLFGTSGTALNKTELLLELLDRVQTLEDQSHPEGFIGPPAYDSGWVSIALGETKQFEHGLNTTEVHVYIEGKTESDGTIHQFMFGGDSQSNVGVAWFSLNSSHVEIKRYPSDLWPEAKWDHVRVMIWRIKPKAYTWIPYVSLPNPLASFGATVVNDKIYVVGGECGSWGDRWKNITYEYNPDTNNWASKATMSTRRGGLAVASANGRIYAIGGAAGISGGAMSTNEEYDPATNSWATKTPMPTPRNWISAVTVNGKIYVVGGSDNSGNGFNANEMYDPIADIWTVKTPIPTARWLYGIGVANDKIYVIGGWDDANLNLNEEYDPATDTWTTKAPMPTPRNGLSIAVVDNKIYAIGGALDANPWTDNLALVEVYDPDTDTWSTVSPMSTPRSVLSAVSIGNNIYSIGGVGSTGCLDTVERFYISLP